MDLKAKQELLRKYTSSTSVMDELCVYTSNKFSNLQAGFEYDSFNMPDEEQVPVWEEYVKLSKVIGVYETLKKYLVQLQFPIRKNISQSSEYRAATLKGSAERMMQSEGLQLKEPDSLDLFIHHSYAGKIPVVTVTNNDDFVSLIRALTYRNEPVKIPESMGAAMIKGLNNWDRIYRLKKEWTTNNPLGSWANEFRQHVFPNKSLYQDKLIVLSKKPYSGVAAKSLGLSQEQWIDYSMQIRLEHECAHFFMLKAFGCMANNMHDELIADYMGVTKVLGKYRNDWFLKFIGLENYPKYREGGRLQNYLNDPPVSSEAAVIVRTIIKNAAVNLELFDEILGDSNDLPNRVRRLLSICTMNLVELSTENGHERLLNHHHNLFQAI